jgi:hypothetical protein
MIVRHVPAGLLGGLALGLLLALVACPEEEGDQLPPQCADCRNDESCPARQPTINPLQSCPTEGAECHYCSEGMGRWVCADMNDDGMLVWSYGGIVDDCPPPAMDTDSD